MSSHSECHYEAGKQKYSLLCNVAVPDFFVVKYHHKGGNFHKTYRDKKQIETINTHLDNYTFGTL